MWAERSVMEGDNHVIYKKIYQGHVFKQAEGSFALLNVMTIGLAIQSRVRLRLDAVWV